jgi:type II secretory pathway pseudopilin PulG
MGEGAMKRAGARGMTLIEMVMIIVVLGIAIPALMRSFADVSVRSVGSETLADQTFYAQGLMEEIRSKKFDEKTASPWTAPLTYESGETRSGTGAASFDDVDDYNGYSDSPAPGYSRCVTVDYVSLSGSSWTGTCSPSSPANCQAVTCTVPNISDYKRIIVRVRRNNSMGGEATIVTIKGVS